jgi:hypothetical protein
MSDSKDGLHGLDPFELAEEVNVACLEANVRSQCMSHMLFVHRALLQHCSSLMIFAERLQVNLAPR